MTKQEVIDYIAMYEVGKVTWGRFRFMMRIFTRSDIKLISYTIKINN